MGNCRPSKPLIDDGVAELNGERREEPPTEKTQKEASPPPPAPLAVSIASLPVEEGSDSGVELQLSPAFAHGGESGPASAPAEKETAPSLTESSSVSVSSAKQKNNQETEGVVSRSQGSASSSRSLTRAAAAASARSLPRNASKSSVQSGVSNATPAPSPGRLQGLKKRVSKMSLSGKKGGNPTASTPKIDSSFSHVAVANDDELLEEAAECLELLDHVYGIETGMSNRSDAVVVMEGWNKVLAFETMFSEALMGRWRILVAYEELQKRKNIRKFDSSAEEEKKDQQGDLQRGQSSRGKKSGDLSGYELHRMALDQVGKNDDPLALCLGTRIRHSRRLIMGMLDGAARSLCPHTQVVQRESYRPKIDDLKLATDPDGQSGLSRFALQEGTQEEYNRLFARCGVRPRHWVQFCKAFLWCMETHVPYADETDSEDLDKPKVDGAYSKFVASCVAKRSIEAVKELREELSAPLYVVCVKRFWQRISRGDDQKALIGETFYRQLLSNHPELLDYFAKADMDSQSLHLVTALDLMIKSIDKIGHSGSSFRNVLDHLGQMHRRLGIPTFSFPIVGGQLLKTLRPFFVEEEELTQDKEVPSKAEDLENGFAVLYMEVMSIIHHPMVVEEKLVSDAEQFFTSVAEELNWPPDKLNRRLLETKLEINASGTYTHTSEELELGARLSWRNSAKCIGRIAWNTLMVRDCRHVEEPQEIVAEVQEHLRIATCGTNIQSVMTVFKPKSPDEPWGTRFWSSQFVRYAGYNHNGKVMGDPANLEFTNYIVKNELWTPPNPPSNFDVLPLVLKLPGRSKPFVYTLPAEFVHEVAIEHPDCEAVARMGLRWAAVPAISNFNMNLGGVDYQCCPFNGWFVSIEVLRNLLERYKITEPFANAMGINTSSRRYEQRVAHEVDVAILHSFEKCGFTMVDPDAVGQSFMVHCKRERDAGRECPGQWSWIGGLTGPTNPTWHKEMRDFYIAPQYEYCCEHWMVTDVPDGCLGDVVERDIDASSHSASSADNGAKNIKVPRVLIAFGSETGTAEAAASRLGRALRLCKPTVTCLNDISGLEIIKERRITHFIAICSTFNRGEFPSNAVTFSQTDIPPGVLADTKVAVLGLGSTLYPDFCRAGVQLEMKLAAAGGRQLVQLNKVDDAVGSEAAISEWLQLVERLVLPKHIAAALSAKSGATNIPIRHEMKWLDCVKGKTSKMERFMWKEEDSVACVGNEELLANGDINVRSTRRVTFEVPSGSSYSSGDHVSVHPLNSLDMVFRFAMCFQGELVAAAAKSGTCPYLIPPPPRGSPVDPVVGWQLQQPFEIICIDDGERFPARVPFRTPTSLAEALQAHVDLTLHASHLTDLLTMVGRVLKQSTSKSSDEKGPSLNGQQNTGLLQKLESSAREIIDKKGDEKNDAINSFLSEFPTIVDFLETYGPVLCGSPIKAKNSNPTKGLLSLAELLAVLPRLQARHYSISSSPQTDPSKVSISVGVLHSKTSAGVMIHGVCSNYLARLRPNHDRANISIRTSSFRGPKDVTSTIMIGAGTGLAPMMGFLQDRAYAIESGADKLGDCHLFFGCRTEDDRIYANKVDMWEKEGVLTHHLALSRSTKMPRAYVQDKVKSFGEPLCELLMRNDTHLYICGDAKIADECFEACVQLLREHGHKSRVGAVQHLKRMRAEDRWQFDLWGIVSHFNEAKVEARKKKKVRPKTWLLQFDEQ